MLPVLVTNTLAISAVASVVDYQSPRPQIPNSHLPILGKIQEEILTTDEKQNFNKNHHSLTHYLSIIYDITKSTNRRSCNYRLPHTPSQWLRQTVHGFLYSF